METVCSSEMLVCTNKSIALKMETACFSEMLVCTYKSTRLCNPEGQHQHLHRRENLKSQEILLFTTENTFESLTHNTNQWCCYYWCWRPHNTAVYLYEQQKRWISLWQFSAWRIKNLIMFLVKFEVLMAASMKMAVSWIVAPRSLVEVYWRFRGACYLHHRRDIDTNIEAFLDLSNVKVKCIRNNPHIKSRAWMYRPNGERMCMWHLNVYNVTKTEIMCNLMHKLTNLFVTSAVWARLGFHCSLRGYSANGNLT
jgi:hypothetical protein